MKKEVLLAIIIGAILGFVSMVVLEIKRRGNDRYQPPKETETPTEIPTEAPTATPVLSSKEDALLNILEPEDETISTKEKVKIKGKSDPLATIVVIWGEGEDILVADKDGFFETEIKLSAGPNEVEISAYNDKDQISKKIITITYSTAKF